MYGYQEEIVSQGGVPYKFGLNTNVKLEKLEWIPNGGKDGAEQEALDIVFNIEGKSVGYRQFPVTRGFDADGKATTDPTHAGFIAAVNEFNANITHIMHAFVGADDLKKALTTRIDSFKEFCKILQGLLPENFSSLPLHVFLQYQYTLKDGAKQTYLEIPKNMKSGKWITKGKDAVGGEWIKKETPNYDSTTTVALWYEDSEGNKHPIERSGYFMTGNSAKVQKATDSAAAPVTNTTSVPTQDAAKSGW